MSDYIQADICIIGAGSGGLSVAAGAIQLGLSVVLIEKGKMGGDCLNTGCIPSKSLLYAGKRKYSFQDAHAHVQQVISEIEPHDSVERFERLGCMVIQSHAKFIDSKSVETENGDIIKAKNFVIATGSKPKIANISGLDKTKILTNETIFQLKEKPTHLVVIGGGPIGVEMAQAHVTLGCDVTVIEMGNIMPRDDRDAVNIIRKSLMRKGVNLYEKTDIQSIEHKDSGHKIILNNQKEIDCSHILMATGRVPSIDSLGLENAAIEANAAGINVNQRLQTNQRHIYAIGDVSGGPQFTHIAGHQAGIVIRNICFKIPAKVNYAALPWVTYASPELAQIGLTETMAKDKYGLDNIRSIRQDIANNDRAIAEKRHIGFIKIIGLKNGKILGVTIVARDAGEMIPLWALAIQKGMKFKDVAGLILPYPTIGEIHKYIAGAWYKEKLFSAFTRKIVRFLQRMPI